MSDLLLSAETGRKGGTRPSRRLRREGKVPAVVYGLDADPVAIAVEWPALRKAITTDIGLNALITLDIDGDQALAVIKDLERHPVRRDVIHVDFLRVTADQTVEVDIPIVLVGEAKNVTMYDGMIDQSMYSITVAVKPGNVPQQIEVDVNDLELGETIKISDIPLPEGAESTMDPEETVAIALITRSTREAIRRAEAEEAGELLEGAEDAPDAGDEEATDDDDGDDEG